MTGLPFSGSGILGAVTRIRVLIRKELVQVLREPRMRVLLILPPVLQLIIFGYAVNLDVEDNAIAWMDQDQSPESRDLKAEFEGSDYFRVRSVLETEAEVIDTLDRGKAPAVVRIPRGFSRDVRSNRRASIQVLIDGTDSNTASIVSNYINRVFQRFSKRLAERRAAQIATAFPQSGLTVPSLDVRTRVWFNPNLRSRDYFVPGVVVNIIALVTIMLTAMAVVREKEIGTMEQLMVTPIRPAELILGKTLPFALIGLLQVALVTSAALLIFGIPFRGSLIDLFASSSLFLLTTLGVGLLISTLSATQQQAMMGSFFFFLPAFMLSGFAFPIRNMPVLVQYLTFVNPVRYFIEIVRGIFLKGIGMPVLWPQMLALLGIGCATIVLSSLRFRKRLD